MRDAAVPASTAAASELDGMRQERDAAVRASTDDTAACRQVMILRRWN